MAGVIVIIVVSFVHLAYQNQEIRLCNVITAKQRNTLHIHTHILNCDPVTPMNFIVPMLKVKVFVYSLVSTKVLTQPSSPSRPVHTETISVPQGIFQSNWQQGLTFPGAQGQMPPDFAVGS